MNREVELLLTSGYTFYLSGPITGLCPDESKFKFNIVKSRLLAYIDGSSKVINPRDLEFPNHLVGESDTKVWNYFMRKSLCEMMEADILVLLDGWENSRGAMIEFKIARLLEMPIISEHLKLLL